MTTADLSFGFSDEGIEEIMLDSRKQMHNALFVPIIGARSDGHDYIEMAIAHGAVAVLSARPVEALQAKYPAVRFYPVEDTVQALQEIGLMERRKFRGPVVGVTGSVGKTTTRSMIAAAIGAGKKVFQTAGNANSQVGVPITMFQMARSGAEAAVIELGISMPGEMTKIAQLAEVDMAVMTNIGIAHIEQLKTQENILREKLHILDGMPEGGVLYLNMEDLILSKVTLEQIHRFGIASDRHIELLPYAVEDYDLTLQVKGRHMLLNASAAMHVAEDLGVAPEKARAALASFSGLEGRGMSFRTRDDVCVIDDAYNASPASMKAGLEALAAHEGKRHIAVLADMLELGPQTLDYHREVGRFLAALPIDAVFLFGERAAAIGEGIQDAVAARHTPIGDEQPRSMPTIEYFTDLEELRNTLHAIARAGDVILFKGSNGMRLSDIVREFRQDKL